MMHAKITMTLWITNKSSNTLKNEFKHNLRIEVWLMIDVDFIHTVNNMSRVTTKPT
jgi:hypothetical protein